MYRLRPFFCVNLAICSTLGKSMVLIGLCCDNLLALKFNMYVSLTFWTNYLWWICLKIDVVFSLFSCNHYFKSQGLGMQNIFCWKYMKSTTVLFVLSPFNTTKVMSSLSVNLSTLFLGRLPKRLISTKCPYYLQLLTTALLESAVETEWS